MKEEQKRGQKDAFELLAPFHNALHRRPRIQQTASKYIEA